VHELDSTFGQQETFSMIELTSFHTTQQTGWLTTAFTHRISHIHIHITKEAGTLPRHSINESHNHHIIEPAAS